MQVETIRKQTKNASGQIVVSFVVFADGVACGSFPTQASAFAYQDVIWEASVKKSS